MTKLHIIGNFPYNISSQIFFKVLENRQRVESVVCMMQKEVAERIASPPGSKKYGILSVLLQAYYNIEYLFSVKPGSFHPPPKVTSGVIRLTRNDRITLPCDEVAFSQGCKSSLQPASENDQELHPIYFTKFGQPDTNCFQNDQNNWMFNRVYRINQLGGIAVTENF